MRCGKLDCEIFLREDHRLAGKHGTRMMAEHYIGMKRLPGIIRLTKCNTVQIDIIGEPECEDVHKDKWPEKKRGAGGDQKPGERLREPEKRGRESSEKPKHVQSAGRHQPIMY